MYNKHASWWLGVAVTHFIRSTKLLYADRVSTAMGDCLRAGKPSRYVTSRLGQLSLSSLQGSLGLRQGAFTCVGWQVTLCLHDIHG